MKKVLTVFGLALLMTVPSWASSLGVGFAYWDSKDAAEDEGLAIKLAFDINDSVDLEFRASFFDAFGQVAGNALNRIEVTPVDFGLSYHFNREAKAQPYLGGGMTFLSTNVLFDGGQVPLAGGPEVDDEFGYYLVAGVDYSATELFGVYFEALFRQVEITVTGNGFGFTDFPSDLSGPVGTFGFMLHW